MRFTPRDPRTLSRTQRRALVFTLISFVLCFAASACGVFQNAPTQRGDWGWMLSDDGIWIHEPGAPHHAAYAATIEAWNARGDLGECDNRWPRVEVIERDGPVYNGQANGYVASSTAKRAIIVVRTDLGPEVTERLIVHEMIHVCGYWAKIGPGRRHEDPRRWRPAKDSVETRATCVLQPELGYCAD